MPMPDRRCPRREAVLAGLALLLAACAAGPPLRVPDELPLSTYDLDYRMRWTLERGPERVRAVGLITTSGSAAREVTLVLYGLDERGRIVSRAYGVVRRSFDLTPSPFEVVLALRGGEARFDLRVWQDVRPIHGIGR